MKINDSYEILLKTKVENIDIITKLMEAFDNLANVRSNKINKGIVKVLTTISYLEDVKSIINKMIDYGIDLEIITIRQWEGEI